jgi:hypothetical protein
MAYKGKENRGRAEGEAPKVHLWTFDTRESLDRFAAVLDSNGLGYEVQTRKETVAGGADGVVIVVDEADYGAARKLLLRHRKRKTSSDLR